ncbi:MAG: DUF2889 domain-containing protein [Novosphingobium sp.]|nr:DUF2889 domain-containing protein [Novosphingobium sp.]
MDGEGEQDVQPAARGLSLTGKPLPRYDEPIRSPVGTTPPRRPGSVRRTMSIDVHWPDGPTAAGHYLGRCRDVLTREAGSPPELLGEAEVNVIAADRELRAVSATPTPPRLQQLVGVRAGGHLRNALAETVPEEKAAGTPLYLVLDDMAGTTLVSRWAFSQWREDWMSLAMTPSMRPKMEGVCIGFRPGGGAVDEDGRSQPGQNATRVVPLPDPADPDGWHELPVFDGVNFRRARRIDVWREGGEIVVESHFQDTSSAPDGGDRCAIHEYLLNARIGEDGTVRVLEALPGTLPYASCRAAPANNEVLIGTHARQLRDVVLERLKFTGGCTHLNDMLRSLAEAPVLADYLSAT